MDRGLRPHPEKWIGVCGQCAVHTGDLRPAGQCGIVPATSAQEVDQLANDDHDENDSTGLE